MTHQVRITKAAQHDLQEIFDWIAAHDSPKKAEYVLDRITSAVEGVARFPQRGSHPFELPAGVNASYRQVFFKPYRVIYRIQETEIIIHVIADGRRNLQALLMRRLTET